MKVLRSLVLEDHLVLWMKSVIASKGLLILIHYHYTYGLCMFLHLHFSIQATRIRSKRTISCMKHEVSNHRDEVSLVSWCSPRREPAIDVSLANGHSPNWLHPCSSHHHAIGARSGALVSALKGQLKLAFRLSVLLFKLMGLLNGPKALGQSCYCWVGRSDGSAQ